MEDVVDEADDEDNAAAAEIAEEEAENEGVETEAFNFFWDSDECNVGKPFSPNPGSLLLWWWWWRGNSFAGFRVTLGNGLGIFETPFISFAIVNEVVVAVVVRVAAPISKFDDHLVLLVLDIPLSPGELLTDFMLKCREQKPRLCDSLVQSSFEHNRLHCLPLNFLRIPLADDTISPFLYLFGFTIPESVDNEAPPVSLPPNDEMEFKWWVEDEPVREW